MAKLLKCETCAQPRSDIEAIRAQQEMIDNHYATIEAQQAWLRARSQEGTLTYRDVWLVTDGWLELWIQVSHGLGDLKRMLYTVRADLRTKKNTIMDSAANYARPGMAENRASSIEERRASYELKVASELLIVDSYEGMAEALEELKWTLKAAHDHWSSRGLDLRMEADRISGLKAPNRNA